MKQKLKTGAVLALTIVAISSSPTLAIESEEDPALADAVLTQELIDLITALSMFPDLAIQLAGKCPVLVQES